MTFEETVGKEFNFYGVDGLKFKLGKSVFEAVEDPDDGYRSLLGSVEVRHLSGCLFFQRPVARVRVVEVNDERGSNQRDFVGFHLVDVADGHVWLRLGTDDYDDYYPGFVFTYQPKAP
ncbi:hypothetical protein HY634_03825 [Candidatus Uhrbacteria bacterium]|nr:hypothetical protein [Candidatus Uhrbacteria bacterium]